MSDAYNFLDRSDSLCYFISPNGFLFYLWTWTLTWFEFHSNIPKSTVCTVLIETLSCLRCYTVRQFYHKFMNFEHQMQTRKLFDIPYMKLNSTHHQQINARTHTHTHDVHTIIALLIFIFHSSSSAYHELSIFSTFWHAITNRIR